ncbi:MAG: SDR family NAD(P)-dependent oxidoreductase [Phycisphaerales bacterium]|jgi:UDP-glucose 4-epimerase
MKILITGGAGFIGSHLAERLLKDGHKVIVIDNLSTGSLENIESFKEHQTFEFVEGDIRNTKLIKPLAERSDTIYHLAAAVGVRLIADDPVHTIATNIGGTEIVLDLANKSGKKILIASSSEVYGKSETIPFKEDDDIVLGSTSLSRWSYACSKAIDEFLGLAYYQQYELGVVIGRFFNTIGPRQTGQYGMVVPRFVQKALNNEPLMIYGTGKQTRCFCYVGDLIEAIINLMNCKQADGKVYNIGSNEEIAIEELADKIIEMTDSKSKKQYVPYEVAYGRPIEDMMRRVPSTKRIKNTIDWEPRTSLTETLRIIIDSEQK